MLVRTKSRVNQIQTCKTRLLGGMKPGSLGSLAPPLVTHSNVVDATHVAMEVESAVNWARTRRSDVASPQL